MGLDSFWHWIILLVVVLVIFGTGKLTKIGPDLGKAMRGFKKALHEDEDDKSTDAQDKLRADPPAAGAGQRERERDSSQAK